MNRTQTRKALEIVVGVAMVGVGVALSVLLFMSGGSISPY